jgi:hypothetical protein
MTDTNFDRFTFSCDGFGFSPDDVLFMTSGKKKGLTSGIHFICDFMENAEDYEKYSTNKGASVLSSMMTLLQFMAEKRMINLSNPDLCPAKGVTKSSVLSEILPYAKESIIEIKGEEEFETMKARWEAVPMATLEEGMESLDHFIKNEDKKSLIRQAVDGLKKFKQAMEMKDEAPEPDEEDEEVEFFQFGEFRFNKWDVVMNVKDEKTPDGRDIREVYSPLHRMLNPYDGEHAHKIFKKALKRDQLSSCVLGSLMGNVNKFSKDKVINLTSPELSNLDNLDHAEDIASILENPYAIDGIKDGMKLSSSKIDQLRTTWKKLAEEARERDCEAQPV